MSGYIKKLSYVDEDSQTKFSVLWQAGEHLLLKDSIELQLLGWNHLVTTTNAKNLMFNGSNHWTLCCVVMRWRRELIVNCARRLSKNPEICADLLWFSRDTWQEIAVAAWGKSFTTVAEYRGATLWIISHSRVRHLRGLLITWGSIWG